MSQALVTWYELFWRAQAKVNGAGRSPLTGVVMSVAKLSAGSGYEYLMRHTARGDAPELPSTAMTRYYTNPGYPAGVWLGRGLAGLGDESGLGLVAGATVTEEQMARLFGAGHDPATGAALGREYAKPAPVADRVAAKVAKIRADLDADVRAAKAAAIEAAERAKQSRGSVAGFDMTFSVPKSVSVLWALSNADTQRTIVDAHHAAVASTLGLIETDVARTRVGTHPAARVPVRGLIAAGFDHHDSRAGDPQLHTHVTIANRVQAVTDGRWRTLDGQGLYAAAVAHSDTYDVLLADNITRTMGLGWDTRVRGQARNARRELAAIPDRLIEEFSQRSAAITAAKDEAIDTFVKKHHRQPTGPEAVRIRQVATLETRQPKRASTLAEYSQQWARRADLILGTDARHWIGTSTNAATSESARSGMTTSANVDEETVELLAARALDDVEARRATWSRWNVVAATCRTMSAAGVQFATERDMLQVRARVTKAAIDRSVLLNPSGPEAAGHELDATTGRSIYDPPEVFTSLQVLAAEDALLDATDDTTAPTVPPGSVDEIIAAPLPGRDHVLDSDQADAVRSVCISGRVVDVLVGPAGTGKTTTMAGLRAAWESSHGSGSVLGLATSAVAADVLGREIDVAAENTAQWLAQQKFQPGRADHIRQLEARRETLATEHKPVDRIGAAIGQAHVRYDRWALHAGQLLVLDEAGMADLPTLNALASQAKTAGAKLLLVGDHAQLPAIGAGGTFQLLADHHTDAPQLVGIRRFTNPDGTSRRWEAAASLKLRTGDPHAAATYEQHGRFSDGTTDDMIDTAYAAWQTDHANGLQSLLVAADNDTVQALNLKVRADRIETGHVQSVGAALHDGTVAGIGDRIVTRRVDRHLNDGTQPSARRDEQGRYTQGFLKNGTAFTVTGINRNGALRVRAGDDGNDVILPADYVAEHVELGYAVTAHRCQGMTVDTTHTIATARMTREAFYVAMTRGRRSNRAYIATDDPHEHDTAFGTPKTSRAEVLDAILAHRGAEQSAHALRQRFTQRGHDQEHRDLAPTIGR